MLIAEAYFFYFYNLVPEGESYNRGSCASRLIKAHSLFNIAHCYLNYAFIVTDNKEPMFEFQKKKAKPKAKVGPNKEALERNRAAAEAYALEASAVTKSELKTQ